MDQSSTPTNKQSILHYSTPLLDADKLDKIKNQFAALGFLPSQITQIITTRQKRTKTIIPFCNTDISSRYNAFCTVLKTFKIDEAQIRNILSHGLIFSQFPEALNNLLQYVEQQGTPAKTFLKLASSEIGCQVLGQAPGKTKRNIEEMASALMPYGIRQKEWIEICLKRQNLLKINADYLLKNMQEMGAFFNQFKYGISEWLKAAQKNPSILDKPAPTLIKKAHEMFTFLKNYSILPIEWVEAGWRAPQIFYQIPTNLQKQILFYTDMYKNNLFIFTQHPQKDTPYLVRYLLKSPQALCAAPETLQLRREYALFMKEMRGIATSEIIYRTKKYILTKMENIGLHHTMDQRNPNERM